jgi:hypothetical protein
MMEEDSTTHSTVSTKKGATEEMAPGNKQPPPSIQLDSAASSKPEAAPVEKRDADEKSFGQLRTPKHANKTMGDRDESSPTSSGQQQQRGFAREQSNKKITPDRSAAMAAQQQQQQQHVNYPSQQRGPSGQEYYANAGEGFGGQYRGQVAPQDAAQAAYYAQRVRMMEQQQQQQQRVPQTISPGGTGMMAGGVYRAGTGAYAGAAAYGMQGGRYPQDAYRQAEQYAVNYGQAGQQQYGYPDARYGYGDGSQFSQYGQNMPTSYQSAQGRQAPHGHYASSQLPPRQTQQGMHEQHDPRYVVQQGNVAAFTRAVSSSFDRSTKSGATAGKTDQSPTVRPVYYQQEPPQHALPDSNASVPDDHSWGQLNQVASVDDSTLARARMENQLKAGQEGKTTPTSDEKEIRQPPSTSSSLTNSPTDEKDVAIEGKPAPSPSKMAPLDSLSSVASIQEPMETSKDAKDSKPSADGAPASPGSSNGSLDLMKCHSGSSGLLHGFPGAHGRSMSGSSFLLDSKRSRDDRLFAAGDARLPTTEGPPHKKSKVGGDGTLKNPGASPLSGAEGHTTLQDRVTAAAQGRTSTSPAYGAFPGLDRAPSYAYSIDSVPSKDYGYPPLPRPGSSSSSTVAPASGNAMQIDGPLASNDGGHRDHLGGALPSWDMIHMQDSFGAGSIGGTGPSLMGNFSFSQDYPMLSATATGSNLGKSNDIPASQAQGTSQVAQQQGRHHGPPTSLAESRNQSFEGGHYHGTLERPESMDMSYTGAPGVKTSQYQQEGYRTMFPPHAPSWGTATSSTSTQPTHPSASAYQAAQIAQYRHVTRAYSAGAMMRNQSEDSATRTSPPAGVAGFQPPPEFIAPQHPQLRRPPPQAVYIMSSDGRKGDSIAPKTAAGGVYGWSKEEDDHLTEVMKRFKNPKDWEPVAKEHGFNKTAKECHERWIRYLKPGVRKGQWTDHEDAIVVEAVSSSAEQPFTRWSDLAQKLPGRVGKQIRDRWVNHLNPNINHMPFSKEDVSRYSIVFSKVACFHHCVFLLTPSPRPYVQDLLLWEGHKQLGKRWVEISTKFFNSSRSENHIKNRWYSASFKKFISNEFGPNAHSGGGKTAGGSSTKKKKSTTKPSSTA